MRAAMRIDFKQPLTEGRLIRRYKRFFADVELSDGRVVVAHCANTGKMSGCAEPGCTVWLEPAPTPTKRKLLWTWVLTRRLDGIIVGVHTTYPNQLAAGAVAEGYIKALAGYGTIRREVKLGKNSRIDIHCSDHPEKPPAWVEVKNVTLVEDAVALFPDAVTERGKKHLQELRKCVRKGERAAMIYVLQRDDADVIRAARSIDPEYAKTLRSAVKAGVEAYGLRVVATPTHLRVTDMVPVEA